MVGIPFPRAPNSKAIRMNWELQSTDWLSLAANGDPRLLPGAISALHQATSAHDAQRAYWQIDNVSMVQGVVYDSALPVMKALLVGLHDCTPIARPYLLELIVQICGGESAPSSREGKSTVQRCLEHLPSGFSTFLFLLEAGTLEERVSCVDLIGLCARQSGVLREQAAQHLRRHLLWLPPIQTGAKQHVESWLAEFEVIA
jgi:hypothetical protein